MSLQTCNEAWTALQTLKLKYLRTWEPTKDSLNLANMTSIPDMARDLNIQMSAVMDVDEIHDTAYTLTVEASLLSQEEFREWNRGEVDRAQQTGQLMSEISSTKLLAMVGF